MKTEFISANQIALWATPLRNDTIEEEERAQREIKENKRGKFPQGHYSGDLDIKNLINWLRPVAANKDWNTVYFSYLWYKLPKREVICYLIRAGYSITACENAFGRGSSLTLAYTRFWQCFRYSELDWAQRKFDRLGFHPVIKIINRNRVRAGMSELIYK